MLPHILVVDDEEKWRNQFSDILETMNYEADAIEGFTEAKSLLSSSKYDLLILDICLEQTDPSYVVFQNFCLYVQEKFPQLPILAVSGAKIEPRFMFHLREKQGVSDFVSKKDLSLEEFKKQIEALIYQVVVNSILFVSADPTDAARLRLGKEFRAIEEQLNLANLRDRFKLELPQLSVRATDISRALLNKQPQIVHFSGHGTSDGALCFENEIGESHFVHPDSLAALFEQFSDQVNCVLLNACYSDIQAKAIVEHIRHVIGMNKAIGDEAAIAFSVGFYQALGAGCTIEESYKLGCVQIRLQGIAEHLTPVLLKKEI
jgi:CheY-like chemotaxis protein